MPSWLDSSQIYLPNPSPLRGGLTTGVHSIRRQQNKKSKQKAPAREILTATQAREKVGFVKNWGVMQTRNFMSQKYLFFIRQANAKNCVL